MPITLPPPGTFANPALKEGEFKMALETELAAVAEAQTALMAPPAPPPGAARVVGLIGQNNGATPATRYDLRADALVLRNPATGAISATGGTATLTNDLLLAVPAVNGRDQAGAFGANSWIHFYFVRTAAGVVQTRSSLTPPPTGPTLAAGEVAWAYAGAVRYDATPALLRTRIRGAWVFLETYQPILTLGSATGETGVPVAAWLLPNALRVKALAELRAFTGASASQSQAKIRLISGADWLVLTAGVNGGSGVQAFNATQFEFPNVGQLLYLMLPNAAGATATDVTLTLYVQAYAVPNGDT